MIKSTSQRKHDRKWKLVSIILAFAVSIWFLIGTAATYLAYKTQPIYPSEIYWATWFLMVVLPCFIGLRMRKWCLKKAGGLVRPLTTSEITKPSLEVEATSVAALKETALKWSTTTKERRLTIHMLAERGTKEAIDALYEIGKGRWVSGNEKTLALMYANEMTRKETLRNQIESKVIGPDQRSLADSTLEEWFGKYFDGEVVGELMYIDKTTFAYLDYIPRSCEIRLLVYGIKNRNACLRQAENEAKGRPYLEIYRLNFPHPVEKDRKIPFFHERWLATRDYEIEIGTDLKSDALGNRQHTLRVLDKAAQSERYRIFMELWEADSSELERLYGKGVEKELFYSSI